MRIGDIFTQSWEIFKRNAKMMVAISVIYVIVVMVAEFVFSFIPVIGFILSGAVSSVMLGGIYLAFMRIEKGETVTVANTFDSIRDVMVNLIIMSALKSLLISIGFLLFVIPGIYLTVSYIFSELLIVDRKMDPWEALEESRKMVTKNWFLYFAFLLTIAVINIIGLIPLGIGLLVTVPLSVTAIVLAYEEEFGRAGG